MIEEKQGHFSGWAIVEVLGHATHIGYVETVNFGAASLFRVDTPELPERDITLTRPEWISNDSGGGMVPAGSLIKREASPAHSVLVGAGSIYRITPCDETAAREQIEKMATPKLIVVKRAQESSRAIVAGSRCEDFDDDDLN